VTRHFGQYFQKDKSVLWWMADMTYIYGEACQGAMTTPTSPHEWAWHHYINHANTQN